MYTFKFEIEIDIHNFVSRIGAQEKAFKIINAFADLAAIFGCQIRAKQID